MKIIKRHKLIFSLIVLVVLLIVILNTKWGRAFSKSINLLPGIIPNSPIETVNPFAAKPLIKEVEFESDGRAIKADLWLPKKSGKFPAAVLHLGVDIDRKDERAQRVARALARSGIATLVPNVPSLSQRRILQEAKEDMVAAFEYLKGEKGEINQDKLGFVAFCASGGLALVAAEDERIHKQVDFIVAVNPYYDLFTLYKALSTHQKADGSSWKPSFKTAEIYNREAINVLSDDKDIATLSKYLVWIARENLSGGNYRELSASDRAGLSKDAIFIYDFLTNKNPPKFDFFEKNLLPEQKELINELSPSRKIENISAKVFLLADVNNVYIPFTEAKTLNETLNDNNNVYLETKLLPGADLPENISIRDLPQIWGLFKFIFQFYLSIS